MKIIGLSSLIFLFSFSTSFSTSFSQSGSIKVTVFDNEVGETLLGATVVIAGTTQGSISDFDGNATIAGLDPGSYDIQISFVSYKTKTVQGVEVTAGQLTSIEVGLGSEVIGLEEIVVTAEVIRNSENALLNIQKKSPRVLDAISSDQFKTNGDNDAAAAVKRVVGVTVESGKYVYVRGLGDRYSKSVLNGADIPSLDPNRNAVQMDIFPSNLIDNIIVYKTFTPDLSGDFSGGLVDISTKDFPEAFTVQFFGTAGANFQSSFNSGFLTSNSGKTDWIGFDNGDRKEPAIIKQYPANAYPSPTTGVGSPQDIENFTQSFKGNDFTPGFKTAPINQTLGFSIGNQIPVGNKQLGIVGGITYNRNFEHYDDGKVNRWFRINSGQTNLMDDQAVQYNDTKSTDEVSWGALFNTTLKLNNANKIGFNVMRNQSGVSETRILTGPWNGSGNFITEEGPNDTSTSRVMSWMQRGVSNAQLRGNHTLTGLNNIQIEWFSSYTYSDMDQPDLRFLRDNYSLQDESNQMSNRDRPSRFFRNMNETNLDNKLSISVPVKIFPVKEGKIKFGGAYTYKDREFRESRYNYRIGFRNYDGDIDGIFSDDRLALDAEGNLTGSTLEIVSLLPNNYDGKQTIIGSFVMVETPVTEKLRTTFGVRVETTDQETESFDTTRDIGKIKETNFLPAMSFTYAVSENSNMRASYSKTLARPTFREFAPFSSFGFLGDNIINGNDALVLTRIDNYDLRYETYPSVGEYFGVSLFYKNLQNPIELTFPLITGENDRQFTYNNVPKGRIAGVEFEMRKSLFFISPTLENFKFSTNLSYIYSEVNVSDNEFTVRSNFKSGTSRKRDMFNQSPYVINASILYDNGGIGWSSGLTFNVFGERLKQIQPDFLDVREKPRPELNYMIKKNLNENWSIRARWNNILNPKYKQVIDFNGEEVISDSYTKGASISLGVSYNFSRS
ncbi:MAG: TonB-dependent receptor [Bacteroidetes bacterium]|nr:TonB-dependent receptor [Bacteroidota bacterium]MDA1122166.1 TonB-dependent receptor [Bacteroidota bacterium]